jgi:hypothetical protein
MGPPLPPDSVTSPAALVDALMQEQQQGENRVKSMLFHMSGEGSLLTTCSKRRSPPGADVPGEWISGNHAMIRPVAIMA